ncbi:hypothetical protein AYO20_07179 [Fonsecaea nubica]|uniref:Uncharacterized protein n=1 Tax=Fonsecaea nubica TaxID=856822 RepID=A0A178CWG0_9EURO|nr:hypothetical protein AYO20_07179 [Fonsecaea nubica]OAL33493.1 hypothetical protein AYO20_07179 [Fonsecaea nubica]
MSLLLWVTTQIFWAGRAFGAVARSETGYSHPCEHVAAIFDAVNYGDGSPDLLSPEVAYECLNSVPVVQGDAAALINGLRGYLEMQSTLDYLAAPTTGWLFPPVDILDTLDQIGQKVMNNEYSSEYDLQVDLHTMSLLGKDDHLMTKGPIMKALTFHRFPTITYLVSLSEDGIEYPSVYLFGDRYEFDDDGQLRVRTGGDYSAITKINGLDVQEFLQTESLTGTSQDPDALYNGLLYPYGFFGSPEFYPGTDTNLTFQNGSIRAYQNYFDWGTNNFSDIVDGETMYNMFFQTVDLSDESDDSGESAQVKRKVKRQSPVPAVISDDAGAFTGYWGGDLPDDVAVLTITSFSPDDDGGSDVNSQEILQEILASAKENGKEHLIIDLRTNGGGSVRLCLETMVQLFPDTPPDTKSSLRANGAQKALVDYFSEQTDIAQDANPNTGLDEEEIYAEYWNSPWAYQTVMSPSVKSFDSADQFYGPYREGPGYFTSYFQENYTNNEYSMIDHSDLNITQADPRAERPFAAENIIILTDGYCASACSIFVEHLKNEFRVMSIVVGGRPQSGPMQTIGGVRGSRLFSYDFLAYLVEAYTEQITANPKSADEQFEDWNLGPAERFGTGLRVNGFNAYRMGEPHNIPLHFAYEAADCRIWYTPEMIVDDTALWNRVAELAFSNRDGNVIDSPYCVEGSTKHPTSISGGVRQGDLGPQTPPKSAFPQYTGWIVNGTSLTQKDLGRAHGFGPGVLEGGGYSDDDDDSGSKSGSDKDDAVVIDPVALQNFKDMCSESITEEQWFVKLMCLSME